MRPYNTSFRLSTAASSRRVSMAGASAAILEDDIVRKAFLGL
jgi:hypothetical protein